MNGCDILASGTIELYFYGELDGLERREIAQHVRGCDACRQALEELAVIREALDARPDVCAPERGWTAFMARLDAAVRRERGHQQAAAIVTFSPREPARPSYAGYLAMAALLALVTMSVLFVARSREPILPQAVPHERAAGPAEPDPSLATISEQHFERSKLVVLDLATREAGETESWARERNLAAALLNDTRQYRMAAEESGMTRLAGVLRDLELVLLQTSMTEAENPAALAQIQRLIRTRDLIGQMEAVSAGTTGS
jgi:hypothetical protein